MADRYWVGGTGTWDTTSTTNWSATSGGAAGASAPTNADNVFFNANSNIGTGSFTVTVGGLARCLNFTASGLDGPMGLATGSSALYVAGNWFNDSANFSISATASVIGFYPPAGTTKTITTNGETFPSGASLEVSSTIGGGVQLSGSLTHLGPFFLQSGNLTLNNFTLTTGTFVSSNTNTKAIAFGSANIVLNSLVTGTTVLSMGTVTSFSWTGTGGFVRNQRATATFTFGTTGGTASNAPNLTFNSVTSTSTFTSGSWFKNLDFSTSTCTINNSTLATAIQITNSLSLNTTTGASTIYQGFHPSINATSTLDTTKALGSLSIDAVGITVSLARATTIITTGSVVMYRGTLALNGFDLTTGSIQSSGSTARSIAFGSNNITLSSATAGATILSFTTATGFSWTGTGGFVRNQAATATVTFGTTGGTAANAPNLTVNAGASALTITTGSWFDNLDFTGSTCTVAGASGANTLPNIAGNLTLATGGTYTAVRPTFVGSSTVTSSGKTIGITTVNGSGITVTLADALTPDAFTLTNGTLNLNGFSLSTSGSFSIGVGTKNITFNGGTIFLSSATTSAWLNSNPTNFTTTAGTGTGTISMTAATAKSFQGGGSTYNCTVNQGGAGDLTITGSNTFDNITNTVQPASILFGVGTTNTFNSFSLSGTAGNLITISTFAAAGTHTLSKVSGVVSVSFCSISYSTATGGASWQAPTASGNVDAGNNTGWLFAGGPLFGDISELITVSDLIDGVYTTFSSIDEQVSLQDTLDYAYIIDSSLSESISSVDLLSATYDAFVACTDSISLSASLSVTADFIVVYTDAISLVDSLSATYDAFVDCTDSISLTESLSTTYIGVAVCVDSISLTDSLSVIYDGIVFSTENVSVSDSQSVIANMSVAVQDSVNALSAPSGRFPWDLVGDGGEGEWQLIKTVPYIT